MYYYMKFYVGSPFVEQSAIIDTGSDTLAFPCDQCKTGDCGKHQDPRFFTQKSKSFNFDLQCYNHLIYENHDICRFTKSYAEGSSLFGFLANDYIKFKNSRPVQDLKLNKLNSFLSKDLTLKSDFGCTTKETGLFKTQFADGILGLDNTSQFITSMEKDNVFSSPMTFSFGLCFHETGGIMSVDLRHRLVQDDKITMLKMDRNQMGPPLVLDFNPNDSYYKITVTKFQVSDEFVDLPPIPLMIDSGTTFSHFPDKYINTIFSSLNKYCRSNRNKCGKLTNPNFNPDSCVELTQPDDDYKNPQ